MLRDYPSFSSVATAKYPDKTLSVGERNLFSSQFQVMVHQSKDVTVAAACSSLKQPVTSHPRSREWNA